MDSPLTIPGRVRLVLLASSLPLLALLEGCGTKPAIPSPPIRPIGPLAIHRAESPTRVFSSQDEVPSATYAFEGAKGSVRVTMEIGGTPGTSSGEAPAVPASLNDVLFKAEGDGRLTFSIQRPSPEHPNGRVAIRCLSGKEESTADFEPELWFHLPGAIITFESPLGEPSNPVVEGTEVVLGRYVARNIPHDIRLTFKAAFTRDPVAPRTKAGIKPPR